MSRDLRDVLAPDQRVDELVRVAFTTDERLDDITRAKIWTRLEDRVEDAPDRTRWRWLVGGALAVAAGIALWLGIPHRAEPEAFVAPRDATLSVKLGPHARASLVGPARLDVIGATGDTTVVALRSGTLVAEFDGGPGRSLRIAAPGATIEIVGTLFAVEVRDRVTCVSVAHGRVRMTTFVRVIEIGGGEAACSDEVVRHPATREVRTALARHAAVIAASDAATPIVTAMPAIVTPPAVNVTPPAKIATAEVAPEKQIEPTTPRKSETPSAPSRPRAEPRRVPAPAPAPESESESASASESASGPASVSGSSSALGADPPPRDPPPPARPAVAPAPPPAARTDSALYREAETAIAKRDLAAADRALAKLVDAVPVSPLLDQALYERARIAYQRHAWDDARRHLDRLAALTSPLAEPGAYLGCKVAVAAGDARADACLSGYRASYPHSPHDLDVLALLVDRAYRAGGCAHAAPLVDELARLYQATSAAHAWRSRCP